MAGFGGFGFRVQRRRLPSRYGVVAVDSGVVVAAAARGVEPPAAPALHGGRPRPPELRCLRGGKRGGARVFLLFEGSVRFCLRRRLRRRLRRSPRGRGERRRREREGRVRGGRGLGAFPPRKREGSRLARGACHLLGRRGGARDSARSPSTASATSALVSSAEAVTAETPPFPFFLF